MTLPQLCLCHRGLTRFVVDRSNDAKRWSSFLAYHAQGTTRGITSTIPRSPQIPLVLLLAIAMLNSWGIREGEKLAQGCTACWGQSQDSRPHLSDCRAMLCTDPRGQNKHGHMKTLEILAGDWAPGNGWVCPVWFSLVHRNNVPLCSLFSQPEDRLPSGGTLLSGHPNPALTPSSFSGSCLQYSLPCWTWRLLLLLFYTEGLQ